MSKTAFLMAAGLTLLASGAAQAADSIWRHNGSVMYYAATGASRTFTYDQPRRGLGRLAGRMLFRGVKRGNRMYGTAWTFKRGCRPAAYSVSGRAYGTRIVLRGAAPVRRGCRVIGYDPYGRNARLVFTYLRRVSSGGYPGAEPEDDY